MAQDDDDGVPTLGEVIANIMDHMTNTPGPNHTPDCPLYRPAKRASSGATSNAYRNGWETIFGGKRPVGKA